MPISLEELKWRRKKAKSCGNEKLNLGLHDIAKVLKELEPSVERQFKNYIKYKAGVTDLNLIDACMHGIFTGVVLTLPFPYSVLMVINSTMIGGIEIFVGALIDMHSKE